MNQPNTFTKAGLFHSIFMIAMHSTTHDIKSTQKKSNFK